MFGHGFVVDKNKTDKRSDLNSDLVCFSHLRWNFVYQRPQHLLSRCARDRRVFFFEEPIFDNGSMRIETTETDSKVHVIVPHLPDGLQSDIAKSTVLRDMVKRVFRDYQITDHAAWYYTRMALSFTDHLKPLATIYDCMDELSAFKGAPTLLKEQEARLFRLADVVFTGGQSLYEVKKTKHRSVHAFPSSIDRAHFMQARSFEGDPEDQREIKHPRLGYVGVIDERLDLDLIKSLAEARPDWSIIMIGPVVKIDPASLPQLPNIYYLGSKNYNELPKYIAGWDVALMPFALNEATKFISPTKTPEYLAAGKPVVSTAITDVVSPYGNKGLVRIASEPSEFVSAIDELLVQGDKSAWLFSVDDFLAGMSWDQTWSSMSRLIDDAIETRRRKKRRPPTVKSTKQGVGAVAA